MLDKSMQGQILERLDTETIQVYINYTNFFLLDQ